MRAAVIGLFLWWGGGAAAQSILLMGDSILVWNSYLDASVVDRLEQRFGDGVENNAAAGAMLTNPNALGSIFGYDIRTQFDGKLFDWVVLNGGANDILAECGCGLCDAVLDDLSDVDGTHGAMPQLVNEIRDTGAQVVLAGYYMPPSGGSAEFGCLDDLAALNARYAALAARDVDVYFLDTAALIPQDDLTLFDGDLLHPSEAGSRRLADAIATIISEN